MRTVVSVGLNAEDRETLAVFFVLPRAHKLGLSIQMLGRSTRPPVNFFVILRRQAKNPVSHILYFVRLELLRFAQDDKLEVAQVTAFPVIQIYRKWRGFGRRGVPNPCWLCRGLRLQFAVTVRARRSGGHIPHRRAVCPRFPCAL